MIKRNNKNKIRCEYCNKFIDNNGVHTKCVKPYVKHVLNESIFVTIFDKPRKVLMLFLMFILMSVSLVYAGTLIYAYWDTQQLLGFYESGVNDSLYVDLPYRVENFSLNGLNGFLNFDGLNDFIQVPVNLNTTENNISFSIWVYSTNNTNIHFIVNDRISDNSMVLHIEGSKWRITTWNLSSNLIFLETTSNFSLNEWVHLAVTYEYLNTNLSFYVNGQFINDTEVTGGLKDNKNNFSLAQMSAADDRYFYGYLDEFRYYNSILTPSEVYEIYVSGLGSNLSLPNSDMIVYYNFNELNGSILNDLSGSSNNGI